MALTPERIAELERLKALMQQPAADAKRKAQAIWNAEQMANKKAEGGSAKSKFVLDASGKPLRVYHGTNQDIQAFDESRLGQNTRQKSAIAHYFTESPQEAGEYANLAARRQVADAPAHEKQLAKLQKQIQDAERRGDWDTAERLYLQMEELDLGAINEEATGHNIVPVHLMASKVKTHDMKHGFDPDVVANLIKQAKAEKMHAINLQNVYDPVAERSEPFSTNQWIMLDPKRIKSAIGNRGTYDTKETDITKADGGTIDMDAMRLALMPKAKQYGNPITHAHHLEIEERPL